MGLRVDGTVLQGFLRSVAYMVPSFPQTNHRTCSLSSSEVPNRPLHFSRCRAAVGRCQPLTLPGFDCIWITPPVQSNSFLGTMRNVRWMVISAPSESSVPFGRKACFFSRDRMRDETTRNGERRGKVQEKNGRVEV